MTRADDDDAGVARIEEWRTISAGDDIACGGEERRHDFGT
jgi:hypothetical protein